MFLSDEEDAPMRYLLEKWLRTYKQTCSWTVICAPKNKKWGKARVKSASWIGDLCGCTQEDFQKELEERRLCSVNRTERGKNNQE